MASWEDEDFEVPVAATSHINFDEEEDELLGDWEAGLDSDEESKPKVAKPKISSSQRIAERRRKEKEERERKALDKTQDASKLEQREKEIASDLNNASDLLSSVDVHPRSKSTQQTEAAPAAPGPTKLSDLVIFKPSSVREYADLRTTLAEVINDLAPKNNQAQHTNFIIELCRDLCKPLKSDQVSRVTSTLTAFSNEKFREERAKRLGSRQKPNLKMAAQKSEKPRVDVKAPHALDDDGLDDDDFM